MDIIGQKIIHKLFKNGIITAFDEKFIRADFPSEGGIIQLSFSSEYFQIYKFPNSNINIYFSNLIEAMAKEKKSVHPKV